MRAFDCRPKREKENRAVWRQRNFREMSSICEIVRPEAYKPPIRAPADAPAIASIGIAFSSNARSTPTCAIPRAAPPESARPTRGRSNLGILLATGLRQNYFPVVIFHISFAICSAPLQCSSEWLLFDSIHILQCCPVKYYRRLSVRQMAKREIWKMTNGK